MILTKQLSGRGGTALLGRNHGLRRLLQTVCEGIFLLVVAASSTRAGDNLKLPPEAKQAMGKMYAGDLDGAIGILRGLEQSESQNPLGFLLEAEAQWWKIYCAESQVKYGVIDAWKRGTKSEDQTYFDLADKAIQLAQARIATSDSAEMHLYAAMGWALKARMHALRGENRAVAHTSVAARSEFLRTLQLDPQMTDATAGIGLYNYYVDSLPGIVKVLRMFMGIPGGNKTEGIQQMQAGIDHGMLTAVEMRFYLARGLRNYDQQYEQAIAVAEPLVAQYPNNPIFELLLGDLNAKMSRTEKSAEYFRAAAKLSTADCGSCPAACSNCSSCGAHARDLANSLLGSTR